MPYISLAVRLPPPPPPFLFLHPMSYSFTLTPPLPQEAATWTRQEVQLWLDDIGMQQYKEQFQAVDGQASVPCARAGAAVRGIEARAILHV